MSRSLLACLAGAAVLAWIVMQIGPAAIGADVMRAGWALPLMMLVHATQLALSAIAWRIALGRPPFSWVAMLRIRWIREGVNSLLPVAQIGGQVAAVRLLTRLGLAAPTATAGTVLDLTLEAAAQFCFTLIGVATLALLGAAPVASGWIATGVLLTGVAATGLLVGQRLGLLRLLEAAVSRAIAAWPSLAAWSLRGLHDQLMDLQRDRAGMARAVVLHTASWSVGGLEVWVALHALGAAVTLPQALVIESLGMVARSAGFLVPGALGLQEGGFLLACGVFGIAPDTALSLSLLKRLREIAVAAPALMLWIYQKRGRPEALPLDPARDKSLDPVTTRTH